jgi:hypothetical protein
MRYLLLAFAFAAALIPAAAAAQATPGPGGPPPDRAKFEQYRAVARANALKALSPDHQAKVQAVVTALVGGSIKMRDATAQIDAILSPDESKALLAQAQQMRNAMSAANGGSNPPPGGAMGQGPPGGAQTNAGRFLLRLLLTPQQMRSLRDQQPKQQ